MKNMLIVSGVFQETNTFRLIPIIDQCPYAEMVYDAKNKTLVLIHKSTKQSLEYVEKLDNKGKMVMTRRSHDNTTMVPAIERVLVHTNYHNLVTNEQDIDVIVNSFAINADTFDYKVFMTAPIAELETTIAE